MNLNFMQYFSTLTGIIKYIIIRCPNIVLGVLIITDTSENKVKNECKYLLYPEF